MLVVRAGHVVLPVGARVPIYVQYGRSTDATDATVGRLWLFLIAGCVVFLFYLFTKEPTVAAVLATVVDALGFGSTFSRGWRQPYKDSVTSFALPSGSGWCWRRGCWMSRFGNLEWGCGHRRMCWMRVPHGLWI